MTSDQPSLSISAVRGLLRNAFTAETLARFCMDRDLFRPVLTDSAPEASLDDLVDDLLEYCRTQLLFDQLLKEVKEVNPRQYARFEPEHEFGVVEEAREAEPAQPSPEILTLAEPIYLDLVRVPAGEFLLGSVIARDKDATDDELPAHRVHVSEFYIGKFPVTNLQYREFVEATGHRAPDHWETGAIPRGKLNHPVVNVSWYDVMAFCSWLSRETGHPFRLPTEAEWEKAARGTDGRIYPWGSELPDQDRCNLSYQVGTTTTVGQYSPQGDSAYGCADMAGNVWEWCQNLYDAYPYEADDGREDLEAEGFRALRGGSFNYPPKRVRCACRVKGTPDIYAMHSGFRLCTSSRPE